MVKNSIVVYAVALLLFSLSEAQNPYGRFCKSGTMWKPAPGLSWRWQLSTTPSKADIDSSNAQVIDLDMYNTPVDLIQYIHSKGKTMICYVDTQYEPNRVDSSNFTANLLGKGIEGWPGQYWVDIRSQVVWNIMLSRAKTAQAKGCDGIEWDDVDGYANDNGFGLTDQDQLTFNKYIANITRALGMSVGLKNDLDQVSLLVDHFDWALNEQCNEFSECDTLKPFIQQGKAVFGTEYTGTASQFCPTLNSMKFSWLLSDLELDGKKTTQCCSFLAGGCPTVDLSAQCVPYSGGSASGTAPGTSSTTTASSGKSSTTGTAVTGKGSTTGTATSSSESESGSGDEQHGAGLPGVASSVAVSSVVVAVSFLAIMLIA